MKKSRFSDEQIVATVQESMDYGCGGISPQASFDGHHLSHLIPSPLDRG